MECHDDELKNFEANGALPLPRATEEGFVENDGASIRYSTYGAGSPVILLHGGLGHSGNWGYQVPSLTKSGYRVILVDSRGHGQSTRDTKPYTYELMASDVLAVMDRLSVTKAVLIGWSDGACTSMVLGIKAPQRVAGVFFFGCNMDPSGTKEVQPSPVLDRCFGRHVKDYSELSATPDQFKAFLAAVGKMMETEPNYNAADLAKVSVPVAVVQSENDEFIKQEHAEYLARTIPGAEFILLPGVSHFAPLQRPELFNQTVQRFLDRISGQ
ncbi:alpha/beta hydrolase [Phyllobacterium sp. YR531]|uniref:alpha/beta fold hydrolase n=1 Tax=Phyllobacterium sp. YR531 TaxID=1144343 RepID=UPI00026F8FA9|nr:alpha/beta hydrolase [Phyllobacterium sp. YR531]EJN05312.1 putative hydrolase or acyltransferase of alpha/beta superfamily [Phyllobacterium sp. YR531]